MLREKYHQCGRRSSPTVSPSCMRSLGYAICRHYDNAGKSSCIREAASVLCGDRFTRVRCRRRSTGAAPGRRVSVHRRRRSRAGPPPQSEGASTTAQAESRGATPRRKRAAVTPSGGADVGTVEQRKRPRGDRSCFGNRDYSGLSSLSGPIGPMPRVRGVTTSVITHRYRARVASFLDGLDQTQHDAVTSSAAPLAVTFTRKAAGELRQRLAKLGVRETLTAGTFHAIALAQLRRRAEDAGRTVPAILERKARLL